MRGVLDPRSLRCICTNTPLAALVGKHSSAAAAREATQCGALCQRCYPYMEQLLDGRAEVSSDSCCLICGEPTDGDSICEGCLEEMLNAKGGAGKGKQGSLTSHIQRRGRPL